MTVEARPAVVGVVLPVFSATYLGRDEEEISRFPDNRTTWVRYLPQVQIQIWTLK